MNMPRQTEFDRSINRQPSSSFSQRHLSRWERICYATAGMLLIVAIFLVVNYEFRWFLMDW